MAQRSFRYVLELADRSGPESTEYERLNGAWNRIMTAVRAGALDPAVLRETWGLAGEAFGRETMQGHVVMKPYGYAGDFEVIDRIYQSYVCQRPHLRRWDEYFQSMAAPKAVRNRKEGIELKLIDSTHNLTRK